MTPPPLPEPVMLDAECFDEQYPMYTPDQMRQYGEACRKQALEEALNCYSPDDTYIDLLEKIRSLIK